jgi:hypothetical protein
VAALTENLTKNNQFSLSSRDLLETASRTGFDVLLENNGSARLIIERMQSVEKGVVFILVFRVTEQLQ